jgi:hypothetical protein
MVLLERLELSDVFRHYPRTQRASFRVAGTFELGLGKLLAGRVSHLHCRKHDPATTMARKASL